MANMLPVLGRGAILPLSKMSVRPVLSIPWFVCCIFFSRQVGEGRRALAYEADLHRDEVQNGFASANGRTNPPFLQPKSIA
jgi:hypothetical protein